MSFVFCKYFRFLAKKSDQDFIIKSSINLKLDCLYFGSGKLIPLRLVHHVIDSFEVFQTLMVVRRLKNKIN